MAFTVPLLQSRHSSVVERVIGNDEVGSSILPGGTMFFKGLRPFSEAHIFSVATRLLHLIAFPVLHAPFTHRVVDPC